MKRNRKVSRRRSVIGMHVMHFGAVLLMFAVMVILNLLASSSCNQLMKSIGEKDRRIQRCQAELDRANARWEATKSTDNLERALGRRGLIMSAAKANQVIRMGKNGVPVPGQRSVALARQRLMVPTTASVAPAVTAPTPRRRVR